MTNAVQTRGINFPPISQVPRQLPIASTLVAGYPGPALSEDELVGLYRLTIGAALRPIPEGRAVVCHISERVYFEQGHRPSEADGKLGVGLDTLEAWP